MGHRLSRIYTRTGDDGSTGLGDGSRIAKDSARVEAYGCVDECNSAIGVLRSQIEDQTIDTCLEQVQHQLFDLGGQLCLPGREFIHDEQVDWLEARLDEFNATLPPLKEFILPAGAPGAALAHLARTICRRTERRLWILHREEPVAAPALKYMNRLSDLLFVIARMLARQSEAGEVLWRHERR